jgi:pyruvate formate-lyase activating enzyme-like uncharacterized protein
MDARLKLNKNIIENNVHNIQNLYLKHLFVLTRIKQQISDCCLEEYNLKIAPFKEKRMERRLNRIKELKKMGLIARDNNMSFYLNSLSVACYYCKMGFGPTINLADGCNRNCFFCFQYRPQNIKKINGNQDVLNAGMIHYLKNYKFKKNIINLGISGGEPLLALDGVLESIRIVKQHRKNKSIIRLYTNGDLLNEGILKKLKQTGLDEIRFGIKYGDLRILNKIILAKKYIPRVLMEGPVFPKSEKFMKKLLHELNNIKIFGINLLDLRCRYNVPLYKKRGYLFDYKEKTPFYEEWYQGWPIYGSEETIFNLLEFAIQKKFSISFHYCPAKQNIKVTYLNSRKREAFANKQYHETVSEEAVLKKIVVYFPSHLKAAEDLKKHSVSKREIIISPDNKRLETHIRNLRHLDLTKYEIGILDTLPNGEEINIEVLKSKALHNVSKRGAMMAMRNTSPFIHIGEFIASVYFRKKSERIDKASKALRILKNGLKILPDEGAIYLALSRIFYFLKEYKKTIEIVTKLMKTGYRKADIYLLLGFCYGQIKQYGKAIEEVRKAEKINPKGANINFMLAKFYRKIGQIEKSNKEIEKGFIKYKQP